MHFKPKIQGLSPCFSSTKIFIGNK